MGRLTLKSVSFSYGSRRVLDGVSLALPEKKLVGIVGPNGCGKSTMISLLARLNAPTGGTVALDGRLLNDFSRRELAKRIAYLPQSPLCPQGITVSQVLRYGRQPHQSLFRQFSRKDAEKIGEIVGLLQLGPILERPMDELSGGQRQKAWLGMVLVQDTDIVLLDEPTSALDIGHQHEVLECIRAICDRGKTVVMVIHDLAAAARFCDELVALNGGNVEGFGAPCEVVREELIRSLYGIRVEIFKGGTAGCPVIVPL